MSKKKEKENWNKLYENLPRNKNKDSAFKPSKIDIKILEKKAYSKKKKRNFLKKRKEDIRQKKKIQVYQVV